MIFPCPYCLQVYIFGIYPSSCKRSYNRKLLQVILNETQELTQCKKISFH